MSIPEYWKNSSPFIHGEVWLPITDFSDYEVSNLGRVRSTDRKVKFLEKGKMREKIFYGKILRQRLHVQSKYPTVRFCKDQKEHNVCTHRLVGITFIANPENKKQLNHKNGIRWDARACNLEWNTNAENNLHAHRVLKRKAVNGESCGRSKLNESTIRDIRSQRESGLSYDKLGKIFNINRGHARDICIRQSWKHVV